MASACDYNTATIPYSNKNTFVSALMMWKSKHNTSIHKSIFYCSSGSREEQSPFPGRGDTEVNWSLLRGTISLPCPPPWITILEEGFAYAFVVGDNVSCKRGWIRFDTNEPHKDQNLYAATLPEAGIPGYYVGEQVAEPTAAQSKQETWIHPPQEWSNPDCWSWPQVQRP